MLGVLERRERVALAQAEELRAELERVQAAVVEADEAARRAVIAREEIVAALAEAAEEAGASGAAVDVPAMGVAGSRVEVPLWSEGLEIEVLPHDCARIVALVEEDAAGGGQGCGPGQCASIWAGRRVTRRSRPRGFGRSGWSSGAG